MATEVIKVIDPDMGSGYDYDSLFDWEAAQQGDLTGARNEIAVAKCRCTAGTADGTPFAINGWVTSATQYIKIWTDPSESYRHNGTYQAGNKYRIEYSNTMSVFQIVQVLQSNVKIIGLQFSGTAGAAITYLHLLRLEVESNFYVDSCVFKWVTGSSCDYPCGLVIDVGQTGTGYATNCIFYDFQGAVNGVGIYKDDSPSNYLFYAYNCTAISCNHGFQSAVANELVTKNCGAVSCTIDGFTNCAQTTCSTTTPTFVNAGADDFHLASNDTTWIGNGTNLYNDADYPFQTDIDGNDRGGAAASWDIGADEYVSPTAIEQKNFRFRNDDDSEPAATWKANQDMNITLAADTAFRLRFLLKATGNPDSIDAQAEARVKPSGGAFGAWEKIN